MGVASDFRKPAWNNPIDTDLDTMRDNLNFLLCVTAAGSQILPGWVTDVDVSGGGTYAEPDGYVLQGSRTIYIDSTYV